MPRYLLLISAFLLLCSSLLSFLNKGKLSASLTDARDARQKVTTAQADTTKARTDLKKAQQTAQEATQAAADARTTTEGLKTQVSTLEGQVKTATDNLAAKDTQIADLNTKLTGMPRTDPNAPVVDYARQIEDLKHQKDELQLVKDSLDTQLKGSQAQLGAAQKRLQGIQDGAAMLGLRGRVLAVNREYNFVVLDLGSRNGVSNNATMIVQRSGSLVGRVRTVSVEPSQTVADIVPNSVPAGVIVQPGDTVIFPGS